MNPLCPSCKHDTTLQLEHKNGTSYVLTEVGANNSINIGSGLIVKAYGCTNCGYIALGNSELVNMK